MFQSIENKMHNFLMPVFEISKETVIIIVFVYTTAVHF